MELEQPTPAEELFTTEDFQLRASTGKRFANYVIDLIFFYVLFFIFGMVMAIVSPGSLDSLADDRGFGLMDRFITLILYALYMSIVEALFKGKSLGKLITRTRAVNLDGTRIPTATAFSRGFSRAVPFCAFSAFGSPCDPWQDRWTKTMVIDERNIPAVIK